MLRRFLSLVLCLTVLLTVLPAYAENGPDTLAQTVNIAQPPVFRLELVDEDGQRTVLGTGLLMLENDVLLTSAALPETLDRVLACGPDGSVYSLLLGIPGEHGLRMLVLNGQSPLPYAEVVRAEDANGMLVGMTESGLQYSAPVQSVARTTFEGYDAWLVSAKEPLLPGAALLDGNGNVMGMTVAEWGEGEARYVAVTGSAFMTMLLGGSGTTGNENEWLTDVQITYEAGLLTLDWSGCEISGLSEDSAFTLYFEDTKNTYVSYITGNSEKTSMSILVVPGREYRFWVRHSHGTGNDDVSRPAERAMTFAVPELGDLTDYGFAEESYLSWARVDETVDPTAELPKLEFISAYSLTNPEIRLYLQVINSYTVTEEIERDMVYVLHTPEDYTFFQGAGYIFGPSYQDRDVWNADITGLFDNYLSYNGTGVFAPGTYTVSYVIGGQWAGGFSFALR